METFLKLEGVGQISAMFGKRVGNWEVRKGFGNALEARCVVLKHMVFIVACVQMLATIQRITYGTWVALLGKLWESGKSNFSATFRGTHHLLGSTAGTIST